MGGLSYWHLLFMLGAAVLIFGRPGRLSSLMGDAAKGIKAFREGLKGDSAQDTAKPSRITEAAAPEILAPEVATHTDRAAQKSTPDVG